VPCAQGPHTPDKTQTEDVYTKILWAPPCAEIWQRDHRSSRIRPGRDLTRHSQRPHYRCAVDMILGNIRLNGQHRQRPLAIFQASFLRAGRENCLMRRWTFTGWIDFNLKRPFVRIGMRHWRLVRGSDSGDLFQQDGLASKNIFLQRTCPLLIKQGFLDEPLALRETRDHRG